MSKHKHFDRICILVLILTLLITVLFMNGEKLGIQVVPDQDKESYTGTEYFTKNDLLGGWDTSDSTMISLEGDTATVTGKGAYVLEGSVYIVQSGTYRVSGTLTDGSVIVDAKKSSKVWILLEGVDIHCEEDACIRVDEADKVFLTLAEGSTNTLTGGSTYSDTALQDGTNGVIYAHDDLTINGSGSLVVEAAYKHGITAKDDLVITGGSIRISAAEDGIHTNDSFRSTGADITISAGDDGITTDGYVYVESGTVLIEECYEGIEGKTIDIAGGEITIFCSDDGLNATDGSSAEFGFGTWTFPGSAGQTAGESSEGTSGDTPEETSEAEIYIRVSGGAVTIINENGIDADGMDSNGDIYITGGTVRISLPGGGSNNAIDVGTENGGAAYISGGTVIAAGSSGMAEMFDSSSGQASIMYTVNAGDTGTPVTLTDADGQVLLSWEVPCSFTSVILSCPELKVGETYTVTAGEESEQVTLESTAVSVGSGQSAGFGGMGGFPSMEDLPSPGGMPSQGEMPEMGEMPETGEMPSQGEMPDMGDRPAMGQGPQTGEGGQFPALSGTGTEAAADNAAEGAVSTGEKILLAAGSALILLAGILIAARSRSFSV